MWTFSNWCDTAIFTLEITSSIYEEQLVVKPRIGELSLWWCPHAFGVTKEETHCVNRHLCRSSSCCVVVWRLYLTKLIMRLLFPVPSFTVRQVGFKKDRLLSYPCYFEAKHFLHNSFDSVSFCVLLTNARRKSLNYVLFVGTFDISDQ